MRVIDVNRWLRTKVPSDDDGWLDEAWVIDPRQRSQDPRLFELSLVEACCARGPKLRPQLVAIPSSGRELEGRLAALRPAGGAAVARICLGAAGHGYPPELWAIAPLPELCDRERLALALDYPGPDQGGAWAEIVRLARTYPRLPIILLAAAIDRGWAADRALDAAPNLILETSAVDNPASLGRLVSEHGAYRFVFGSGAGRAGVEVIAAGVQGESDLEALIAGNADLLGTGRWGEAFL